MALLRFEFHEKIKERLQIFFVRTQYNGRDFCKIHEQAKVDEDEKISLRMRPKLPQLEAKYLNVTFQSFPPFH